MYLYAGFFRYICIYRIQQRAADARTSSQGIRQGLSSMPRGKRGRGRAYSPDDVHDGSQPKLEADAGRRCHWHCPRWHSWRWPAAPHADVPLPQPAPHDGRGHDDGLLRRHDDANADGDAAHGDGHADGHDDRAALSIATFRLVPSWPPHLNQTRASPQNPADPQSRCH